jgi:hypothetical protein
MSHKTPNEAETALIGAIRETLSAVMRWDRGDKYYSVYATLEQIADLQRFSRRTEELVQAQGEAGTCDAIAGIHKNLHFSYEEFSRAACLVRAFTSLIEKPKSNVMAARPPGSRF